MNLINIGDTVVIMTIKFPFNVPCYLAKETIDRRS